MHKLQHLLLDGEGTNNLLCLAKKVSAKAVARDAMVLVRADTCSKIPLIPEVAKRLKKLPTLPTLPTRRGEEDLTITESKHVWIVYVPKTVA